MFPEFEKDLQERFRSHEVPPPPEVWNNLSSKLPKQHKQNTSKRIVLWGISAAASAIILITIALLRFNYLTSKQEVAAGSNVAAVKPSPPQNNLSSNVYPTSRPETFDTVALSNQITLNQRFNSDSAKCDTRKNEAATETLQANLPPLEWIPLKVSQSDVILPMAPSAPPLPQFSGIQPAQQTPLPQPSAKELSVPQLIGNAIAQRIHLQKAIHVAKRKTPYTKTIEVTLFENKPIVNN